MYASIKLHIHKIGRERNVYVFDSFLCAFEFVPILTCFIDCRARARPSQPGPQPRQAPQKPGLGCYLLTKPCGVNLTFEVALQKLFNSDNLGGHFWLSGEVILNHGLELSRNEQVSVKDSTNNLSNNILKRDNVASLSVIVSVFSSYGTNFNVHQPTEPPRTIPRRKHDLELYP